MTAAAKRVETKASPPLADPPSSNAGAMPVGASVVRWPPWAFVFLLCLLLYVVHAAAAIATVALAGVVLALLASRTRLRASAATAVLLPCLAFLLLFPVGYSILRSPALAFPQSYLGRSLTLVLIPAGLALL